MIPRPDPRTGSPSPDQTPGQGQRGQPENKQLPPTRPFPGVSQLAIFCSCVPSSAAPIGPFSWAPLLSTTYWSSQPLPNAGGGLPLPPWLELQACLDALAPWPLSLPFLWPTPLHRF